MKAGWARLVVVALIFLCFGYWIRGKQSTQGYIGGAGAKLEAKPSTPSGSRETTEDQISFPSDKTGYSTEEGKQGVMAGDPAVKVDRALPTEGTQVVELPNSTVTNSPRGNPLLQSNALMQEYFVHQRAWLQLPEPERAARQKAFNELEAKIRAASSDSERNALMNKLHELP
jgi:hypothetical protein